MAFSSKGHTQTALAEINITPLVDVVLVLLLIFMLTAPMLQSGVEVAIPKTRTVNQLTEERMVVTIDREQNVFLQDKPALATGRGEEIVPLDNFPALRGVFVLLIHPGFGISTAWAYQTLTKYPDALNGRPGRARKLISLLQTADLVVAAQEFYNSLEAPVLNKYPLLALLQEFLRANGAAATLMSGSGSTTFALVKGQNTAEQLREKLNAMFGENYWTAVVAL